jgi:hypothetical protein
MRMRGFFRLGLVLWVLGGTLIAVTDKAIPSLTRSCQELRDFKLDRTGEQLGDKAVYQCEVTWQKKQLEIAGWVFGLPILALMIGYVLSGFREQNSN